MMFDMDRALSVYTEFLNSIPDAHLLKFLELADAINTIKAVHAKDPAAFDNIGRTGPACSENGILGYTNAEIEEMTWEVD